MKQLIALLGSIFTLFGCILLLDSAADLKSSVLNLLMYVAPFVAILIYYLFKLVCMYPKLSIFLQSRINLTVSSFLFVFLLFVQCLNKGYLNDIVFNLFVFTLSWVWSSWCLVAEKRYLAWKNQKV